jgi:hypothetical protein
MINVGENQNFENPKKGKVWLIKGQSTKLVLSQPNTMEARI